MKMRLRDSMVVMRRVGLAVAAGACMLACSAEDECGFSQTLTVEKLQASPEQVQVQSGQSVSLMLTSATVLLDPNSPDAPFEVTPLSTDRLEQHLSNGDIIQSDYDAIVAVLSVVEWSSDDATVVDVELDDATADVFSVTATATAHSAGSAFVTASIPMEFADPGGYDEAMAIAEDTGEEAELAPVEIRVPISVTEGE